MKHVLAVAATVITAGVAQPVAAQTVKLDEGTFRVLVSGREVGMETFSIRQTGSGASAVIISQGRVVVDAAPEVTANVRVDGDALRPVAYDVELRGADARRIRAAVTGNRASARTVSPAGETMKEYLVSDGAVLVDEGVAHHYYFIARRAPAGSTTVPIINPRENRQVQSTVTMHGEENVSVAGTSVRARKLTVEPAGGDTRSVWIDSEGRVLRVEIPARNYVAVRTTLP
jgi:hypothetical protein